MKTSEIKKYLIDGAIHTNGCNDGVEQLREAGNNREMLQVFLDRKDFCLSKNFPTKDELKMLFPNSDLKNAGFYIDEKATIIHNQIPTKTTIVLGNSDITYYASGYSVSKLYIKQNAKIRIIVSGHARLMIDGLDNAVISVESENTGRVSVNLYAKATCSGNAKTNHTSLKTYEL